MQRLEFLKDVFRFFELTGARIQSYSRKSVIKANRINEIWYDLRYGISYLIHQSDLWGIQTYTPPMNGRGNDWIFVLEDASAGYALPGQAR